MCRLLLPLLLLGGCVEGGADRPPRAAAEASAAAAVAIPTGQALHDAIAARSEEYFSLFFEGCDPARLRTMLMPDIEMYHDRGGVRARSAEPFVARYAERCRARAGAERRLRRVLVPGSLHVDPVPGYGAIEEGRHDFYRVEAGRPDRRVETARYLHLWALAPDGWRLSRVFSYAHRPTD